MFEILFFYNERGISLVKNFIDSFRGKLDKNSRLNLEKIEFYLDSLRSKGLRLDNQKIKHIEGELWELRPLKNRIFFFCWHEKNFVLLHFFVKKSQKTPKIEIKKAQNNLKNFLERSQGNDD